MTPEVEEAVEEIKAAYGEEYVEVKPEAQGGAYVIVNNIEVGDKYIPSIIWCGFVINYTYPASDVYPHFVNPEIKKANEDPNKHYNNITEKMGAGFSGPTDWNERKAVQVSRKSNRWNAAQDTALIKLNKVINWMKNESLP